MLFLYILGAILALLLLILALPMTLAVRLDGQGSLSMKLRLLGLPLWRSPKRERPVRLRDYSPRAMERRRKKQQKKAERIARKKAAKQAKKGATPPASAAEKKPDVTGGLVDKLSFITELVTAILQKSVSHTRIKVKSLAITVGSPDAARTALIYGALCPALAFLLETLEQSSHLHISPDAPVGVAADFTADKIRADLSFVLRLHGIHLLHIGLHALKMLFRRTMKNGASS